MPNPLEYWNRSWDISKKEAEIASEQDKKVKDGAERQTKFRAEKKKRGLNRHEFWLTRKELMDVRKFLKSLREDNR